MIGPGSSRRNISEHGSNLGVGMSRHGQQARRRRRASSLTPRVEESSNSRQTSLVRRTLAKALPVQRRALVVILTGMLSAAIAFYSPTLFSYFSAHPPPIFVKAEKSANMPFDMVVPSDRTSVPPPPGCDGFHAWGLQQGGVDAGQTNVSLIVQGNTDANVYISGIHASLTSREPLSQGAHVNCQSEGR